MEAVSGTEAAVVAEVAEVTGPGTESGKLSSRSLVSKSECVEAVSSEATASLQPASDLSFSGVTVSGDLRVELQTIHRFSQSRRRPLLWPSLGWKRLQAVS